MKIGFWNCLFNLGEKHLSSSKNWKFPKFLALKRGESPILFQAIEAARKIDTISIYSTLFEVLSSVGLFRRRKARKVFMDKHENGEIMLSTHSAEV